MSYHTGNMMTASQMLTTKRLKGELQKLEKERESYYQVVQDDTDPLLFYFLLRGASDSVYKGGYYIGKIVLPKDYPTNPGDFYMLTPSGRFSINTKICLTNSGYHKESWTPMWNISNMVIGFVSVFLTDTTAGISHIKETPAARKNHAALSMAYNLTNHKDICSKFDQYVKLDGSIRTDKEVEEFVQEKIGKFKKVKKDTKKVVKKTIVKDEAKTETKKADMTVETKTKTKDAIITVETKTETKDAIITGETKDEQKAHVKTDLRKITRKIIKPVPVQESTIPKQIVKVVEKSITCVEKSTADKKEIQNSGANKVMENATKDVIVVKKILAYRPKSYEEWKHMIAKVTIRTHNPQLFNMIY